MNEGLFNNFEVLLESKTVLPINFFYFFHNFEVFRIDLKLVQFLKTFLEIFTTVSMKNIE